MQKKLRTCELLKRFLITLVILAVYIAGRSILLTKVDVGTQTENYSAQQLITAMISGDRNQNSLFAVGLMPGIFASLVVQIGVAFMNADKKKQISPKSTQRLTLFLTLVIAVGFAVSRAEKLVFLESKIPPVCLKIIVVAEMVMGVMAIYLLAETNKKKGIGGQSTIILVNVFDNFLMTLRSHSLYDMQFLLILCVLMCAVIGFMENKMIKIPVQRVSIHNIYADRNYLPYKLNVIGVMPVMFAATVFQLPRLLLHGLNLVFRDNSLLTALYQQMDLTHVVGIATYLAIVMILTIVFAFVVLSPADTAEQLQKGGDSLVGVYAGTRTKRYLTRRVFFLSLLSGTVLTGFMAVSLFLAVRGDIPADLAMLPCTAMLMVGLFCNLYQEIRSYVQYDSYKFFI